MSGLTIASDGTVARVWLDRPDVRNALDTDLIGALTRGVAELGAAPGLRAIVLGGRGKAFCAGADLNSMRAIGQRSWDENRADAQALADMLWALYSCPLPIVGRIHGDCYAGGVGLAAVCDIALASERAQFCLSEARLGLLPATIGPYVVRAMGEREARRWFVTAERFDARTAQRIGLVHEVCADADALDGTLEALLAVIVANGPEAVKACKRLVLDIAGAPLDAALRAETARRIADIRAGDEGREGVAAFLAQRAPAWVSAGGHREGR